jgi:predicted metal-dependent TIM-barrel fold hydrolase
MPESYEKFIITLHLELRSDEDVEEMAEDWIHEVVEDAQRHLYESESCKVVRVKKVDTFPKDSFYDES